MIQEYIKFDQIAKLTSASVSARIFKPAITGAYEEQKDHLRGLIDLQHKNNILHIYAVLNKAEDF